MTHKIPNDDTLYGIFRDLEDHSEEWHRYGILADRLRELGYDEYADGAMWMMEYNQRPFFTRTWPLPFLWLNRGNDQMMALSYIPNEIYKKMSTHRYSTFPDACIALWDALIACKQESHT